MCNNSLYTVRRVICTVKYVITGNEQLKGFLINRLNCVIMTNSLNEGFSVQAKMRNRGHWMVRSSGCWINTAGYDTPVSNFYTSVPNVHQCLLEKRLQVQMTGHSAVVLATHCYLPAACRMHVNVVSCKISKQI